MQMLGSSRLGLILPCDWAHGQACRLHCPNLLQTSHLVTINGGVETLSKESCTSELLAVHIGQDVIRIQSLF